MLGEKCAVFTDQEKCKHQYVDENGVEKFIIPDIVVKSIDARTRLTPIYIDVSVTDPSNKTSISNNSVFIQGAAAADRYKEKMTKYEEVFGADSEICEIIPLIFESTGFPLKATREFFEDVSKRFAGGESIGISKLFTTIVAKMMLFTAWQFENGRYTSIESELPVTPSNNLEDTSDTDSWSCWINKHSTSSSSESDGEIDLSNLSEQLEDMISSATTPASVEYSQEPVEIIEEEATLTQTSRNRKRVEVSDANTHSMRTRSRT